MDQFGVRGRGSGDGPLDEAEASAGGAAASDELLRQLRQRTRELEESQARFRNIIQRTVDGIVITGPDGKVLFVNPAAEALFGRPAAELIGEDFGFPIVGEETTELDIVQRDSREPVIAELRTVETQWDGAEASLISLRDITDRKKSEQRAQRLLLEQAAREQAEENHRRLRFLTEASAVLNTSLALDTTLPELARLIVSRLADWCFIDVLAEENAPGAHARVDRLGRADELAEEIPDPDAWPHLALELLGSRESLLLERLDDARLRELVRDEAGIKMLREIGTDSLIIVPLRPRDPPLGAITLGCTDRDFGIAEVSLAEELAERTGRAVENARLYQAALTASRAKSDFLAIVSHELRTPLNAIIGYTDMLLAGIGGDLYPEQVHRLHRIDVSAHHLLQIIQEILAYAELDAGRDQPQPRHFSLGQFVESVTADAAPEFRDKELQLDVHSGPHDTDLFTDPDKVRQITLNLLANAAKFTESGRVTLHADVDDDELVVTVADTGIGIAPEHLERVFEPFWQAEQPLTRHAGGTGLGLSVSRRFAEMLGGTLTAASKLGTGSSFTLRVPARLEASPA